MFYKMDYTSYQNKGPLTLVQDLVMCFQTPDKKENVISLFYCNNTPF